MYSLDPAMDPTQKLWPDRPGPLHQVHSLTAMVLGDLKASLKLAPLEPKPHHNGQGICTCWSHSRLMFNKICSKASSWIMAKICNESSIEALVTKIKIEEMLTFLESLPLISIFQWLPLVFCGTASSSPPPYSTIGVDHKSQQ